MYHLRASILSLLESEQQSIGILGSGMSREMREKSEHLRVSNVK